MNECSFIISKYLNSINFMHVKIFFLLCHFSNHLLGVEVNLILLSSILYTIPCSRTQYLIFIPIIWPGDSFSIDSFLLYGCYGDFKISGMSFELDPVTNLQKPVSDLYRAPRSHKRNLTILHLFLGHLSLLGDAPVKVPIELVTLSFGS